MRMPREYDYKIALYCHLPRSFKQEESDEVGQTTQSTDRGRTVESTQISP